MASPQKFSTQRESRILILTATKRQSPKKVYRSLRHILIELNFKKSTSKQKSFNIIEKQKLNF